MFGLGKKKEITNEEAMGKFQDGDSEGFDILLHRHSGGVLRFIMKMIGANKAQAEDLLQDVFMKVIENRNRYEPAHKFTTWLYSIARNHCIDYLRRQKYRRHKSLDAPLSNDGTGSAVVLDLVSGKSRGQEKNLMDRELREILENGIEDLREEFREVFLLREIEGLSYKEIAEITDAPLGTVKSRLRYAYLNLREVFTETGYFEERQKAKGV